MNRGLLLSAGAPLLIGVAAAGPVGLALGPVHWGFAAVAFGLCVPVGVAGLVLSDYLGRVSPYGRILGLMVGTGLRLVVGIGGAVAVVFLALPDDRDGRVGFLGWVLFAYLVTLVTDTVVLVRRGPGGVAKT